MRVADIDRDTRIEVVADPHGRVVSECHPTHPHTDVGEQIIERMHHHGTSARARTHRELVGIRQPGGPQVVGEDADAVAAHLGDGAVSVSIVHEPVVGVDAVGQFVEDAGAHEGHRPRDAQHAVGPDTALAIADRRHEVGREVEFDRRVGEHDEVVLGAVPLHVGHCLADRRHPSRIRAGGSQTSAAASAASRSAGVAASSQWMR
ncbi:Uncharacterised protein [Mycobacteroides abscessus subsp. abscessus]|nr:Uncharacterised protein [Mycobacteroides abscessus subsp. abscessus]